MNTIGEWIAGGVVNWRTTLTGIIAALLLFLKSAGYIHLTDADTASINAALIVIFSWFAKDSNKTGNPTN